jgi:Mrp family chromosome partitioning ATPase
MSRNFDILQKLQADAGMFGSAVPPASERSRSKGRTNGRSNSNSRGHLTGARDEIMKLVQRVFILPGAAKAPGIVGFCSVNRGSGCSWVCARTGEMLAEQENGSVCLVDANLRSPSLHDYFRFENAEGFAEAIRGSQPMREFARRASGSNLWLITAGTVGREPNGALHPARLKARFAELRGEFDYVLIDTPATDAYPDAVLLGQLTDGVVLVVDSHSTRREPARIAKESFEAARIPVLGAVLNKRTYPIPEPLYRKL